MLLPPRIPSIVKAADPGLRLRSLYRRDSSSSKAFLIIGIVAGVAVALCILAICIRASRKRKNNAILAKKRGGYQQTGLNDDQSTSAPLSAARSAGNTSNGSATETNRNRNSAASAVDRNTSVRSVMTLPAYRHKASETEQVLGREGERDGVDVVLELPTAEEDETMREEEMEALYQIRAARRREIAEREERRTARRQARARGDMVALADLNERARAASNSSTIEDLRAEHSRIKQSRQRAVSSVNYADLGVARHDGTRIRNSMESETIGLLSDAASISNSLSAHHRERSNSSVISFDSLHDPQFSPGLTRSGATTPRLLTNQHTGGTATAGSSPEIIGEADLGESAMPPHEPPGYEDVSLDDAQPAAGTRANQTELPPDYSTWDANDPRLRDAINAVEALNRMESNGDFTEVVYGGRPGHGSNHTSPRTEEAPRRSPSAIASEVPQIVVQPSNEYARNTSYQR